MAGQIPVIDARELRRRILGDGELALIDVREVSAYARGHIFYAACLPLGRLELLAPTLLPCFGVPMVVCDGGEGLASRAAARLSAFGYRDVAMLAGGSGAWAAEGGELFSGTNVPSKAFGEFVEHRERTPSLSAEELKTLADSGAGILILDSRPVDEYRAHCIPGGVCVPGAELAYRVHDLAGAPDTRVVVNCAGRTRSIIGAQSLINAGVENVASLRNGTMGWRLAGFALEFGATGSYPPISAAGRAKAKRAAARVAQRFGVRYLERGGYEAWRRESDRRTLYVFDVRSPEEFEAGHLPGAVSAPGGQLVQESDGFAPVLRSRVVLVDDDGVRATMTASWLVQMGGHEVAVLAGALQPDALERGPERRPVLGLAEARRRTMDAAHLRTLLARGKARVVDLGRSGSYRRAHLPGAVFARRTHLAEVLPNLPGSAELVLTSENGDLARLAAGEAEELARRPVHVLSGGTEAWRAAGHPMESGGAIPDDQPDDRWLKPYERDEGVEQAMKDYLTWELGLVEQTERDGTAHWIR